MKISKILFLIIFLLVFTNQLFSQSLEWEKSVCNNHEIYHLGTKEGFNYFYGNFIDTITLGNIKINGNKLRTPSAFIAKYNENGDVDWAKGLVGDSTFRILSACLDDLGNIYISGIFVKSATIDNIEIKSNNSTNNGNYVAKFNKEGNLMWIRSATKEGSVVTSGMALDHDKNVYITGFNFEATIFENIFLEKSGLLIAKYDKDGNFLWAKNAAQGVSGENIAIDNNSNIFITGEIAPPYEAIFEGVKYPWKGVYRSFFVAKYDTDGNFLWVNHEGGTEYASCESMILDSQGNCYAVAEIYGSGVIEFGNIQISANNRSRDGLIVKYDNNGNLIWLKKIGDLGEDNINGISMDENQDLYITGDFNNTVDFGGKSLSTDFTNGYIAKYDKNSNLDWVIPVAQADRYSQYHGLSLSVDESDNIYSFTRTRKNASYNHYINKYVRSNVSLVSPSGNEQWRIGTKQNIIWTTNTDKIMLQLSTNGGTTWIDLNSNPIDGKLGSHTITVPNRPSTNCKIRIYSPDYPDLAADTSGLFTITNQTVPTITTTSPNGKEKWLNGTEHEIKWTSALTGNSLSIEYTKDGGISWNVISSSIPSTQNSFKWIVPTDTSDQCRIRIKDNSNSSVYDISDNLFTVLPRPRLLYPNSSNDTLRIAQNVAITWSSPMVSELNIYYSTDEGKNWKTAIFEYYGYYGIGKTNATTGKYSWLIPTINTSNKVKLKIVDVQDSTIFDETDNLITIYNPITITYPSSADTLQAGNFYDITWVADKVANIKIEYLQYGWEGCEPDFIGDPLCDTALSKREFVRSLPYDANLGIYTWIVPDISNPRTLIRITDTQNPLLYSESERFVISPMPSPDSLLAQFLSNSVQLKWKDQTDYEEGFKIERKQGMGSYSEIASVGMDETSYSDNTIDPNNITSYSYRIKAYNQYASSPYVEISMNPTSVENENKIPQNYSLDQNYPNPFNPSTVITFSVPRESQVKLTVYNSLGERVKELFSGVKSIGYHEINFNASGLSSGLYFYSLEAVSSDGKDSFRQIKKMMLVK